MKRLKILLVTGIVVFIFAGFFGIYCYYLQKVPLEISFITSEKHTEKSLTYEYALNSFEWIIIHGEGQKNNFEKEGYVIPSIDFDKNYLIISRYKITKLYRTARCNECEGVPDGCAVFDKKNSDKDYYYFYLMPKIMLSQGVG